MMKNTPEQTHQKKIRKHRQPTFIVERKFTGSQTALDIFIHVLLREEHTLQTDALLFSEKAKGTISSSNNSEIEPAVLVTKED